MKETFGQVLRKARKKEKLSIRQLSEKIGFGRSYVGDVERGKNPSRRLMLALRDVLPPDTLRKVWAKHLESVMDEAPFEAIVKVGQVNIIWKTVLRGTTTYPGILLHCGMP